MIRIRLPHGEWHYDQKQPLGEPGGFGCVYRGQGPSGDEIAVKKLHIEASTAAHRELELADAIADRRLRHVIPVLDAGQDSESDGYFVVMALAEHSLRDQMRESGPSNLADAIEILSEIVAGLKEIPDLVHRDLKPENVLRHDACWKLADFGIARFLEGATSKQTLKGCLSPLYAAPEQWNMERSTRATDLYALGCIEPPRLFRRPVSLTPAYAAGALD